MKNKGKAVKVVPSYHRMDSLQDPHIEVSTIDFKEGLEWLQKQVKGHIEHYQLAEVLRENNIDCWINEEGKLLQMDPTFALATNSGEVLDYIAGPVLFTGFNAEGETLPLNDKQVEIVYKWLKSQSLIGVKHYETVNVVMKVKGFSNVFEN